MSCKLKRLNFGVGLGRCVRMSSKILLTISVVIAGLCFSGCDGSKPVPTSQASSLPASTRFQIPVGGQVVSMRLAISVEEQRRGLMNVPKLEENEGMIFIKATPERAGFWMKNTLIALDIGFFDSAGTLLEVRRMWPHEERITTSSSEQVKYCLEMNHNWFSSKGLKVGAKLDVAALREAVKSRGADPAGLGM